MVQKGFVQVIILIVIFLGIGVVGYYLLEKSAITTPPSKKTSPATTIVPKETNTNEKWKYNDNQCISYKYLSIWLDENDPKVDNLPESGINWVRIYKEKNSTKEIARVTITTNGYKFNFNDYKSKFFNSVTPAVINNKNVYYSNYKYLIETNCPNYYLLIDITDKNSLSTFQEIVQDIE